MSMVRQVGLLPAGCQPWNTDVCAASGDRFAYCATLAVYIYQLNREYNEFQLHSIMSEHKKTITAISWNQKDTDLFTSAGADNHIYVWNVAEQRVLAKLDSIRAPPSSLGWCPHDKDCIAFVYGRGPLFLWNYVTNVPVTVHKDAQGFSSDICQFRWHHKKMGKLVFGHSDGSVSLFCPGYKNQKHVLRPDPIDGCDDGDPVVSLEWDPLSLEYLLLANQYSGVRLVDTESLQTIMQFQLPSVAAQVQCLAWITSAPGMFLTGDSHTGAMRLWTVAKATPLENIRLKKTGFHAIQVFSTTNSTTTSNGNKYERSISSTTESKGPTMSANSHYALPPAHALCTFLDGGVGLYDLGKRKWNFLRDQGHIETIFDCKFKPDDCDLLATGSFDGTIKIWNINTLTPVESSPGNEGVIYCLAWAPADLNCIAAATSKQGSFIWDMNKAKIIKRFNEHGKGSVYAVAWNQKDSRFIATGGADGHCIVQQVDGKIIMKYRHPGPVFGCEWSPNNKDILATTCEDQKVRVYYLATATDKPLKVFSGHVAKVFHVRWSPLRDNVLASGSDDSTVRVWDYAEDTCACVLSGHTAPVRGLLWNTEIPYLLLSGSWDYSIRIWDTRDGACIDTILDHGADVYGLTCHPRRPFVLASSSRDSTVRIWSLTSLVQPLEINLLANKTLNEVIAGPATPSTPNSGPLLYGKASSDIRLAIEKLKGRNSKLKLFSKFFSSPGGAQNLWELVAMSLDIDDHLTSASYSKGIIHTKHLTKFKSAVAQELEMVRMSKFGSGVTREEHLKEAASIHIKLGNIQRYCEVLVELGEWQKALSISPSVSMSYWRSLADRYKNYLLEENNDDSIALCVATGSSKTLVDFFTGRGQLQDALLVATAASEGSITDHVPPDGARNRQSNGHDERVDEQLLFDTCDTLANFHFRSGVPALAACCHLAVDDHEKCISKLIRGHELELAVNVSRVLGKAVEHSRIAVELLSRRCEKLGHWELGVDLLKTLRDPDLLLSKLCARCSASMVEINELHNRAGLPDMEQCLQHATSLQQQNSDVFNCVRYYLLSTSPDVGLQLGLQYVKGQIRNSGWKVNDVFEMLQLISCIQTEKLQQHKIARDCTELLILTAYVGGLVAMRRQYHSIVVPLYKHAIWLMEKNIQIELPINQTQLTVELEVWQSCQQGSNMDLSIKNLSKLSLTSDNSDVIEVLIERLGEELSPIEAGPDIVGGSTLPCHSDVHYSTLTQQCIQGPVFFLEDGKAAISISDAIMWAKVNPFSPLGSSIRINPF